MRSMSIRTKVVLGLCVLLVLMIGQANLGIHYVTQQSRVSKEIATTAMERVHHINHLSTALVEYQSSELRYIVATDPEHTVRTRERLDTLWGEVMDSLRKYRKVIDNPERMDDYEALLPLVENYGAKNLQVLTQVKAGERSEVNPFLTASQADFDQLMDRVEQLRHAELDAVSELAASARDSATRSRSILEAIALIVVLVAVGLALYTWRSLSRGLKRLLAATGRVSQGDLSRPVPVLSGDEFGELARSFNTMVRNLKQSQEENTRLSQQSLSMREEHVQLLRESLTKVVSAQEEERKRVARELHDQAGQALVALKWGLTQLEQKLESSGAKERVASLRSLTEETAEGVRNLALDLRPAALDELGLVPALRSYVRDLSERVDIPIHVEVSGMDCRLSPEAEVALFRTIQEALTNMAKHSQAGHAKVVLRALPTAIEARVEDNGVGFDVPEVLDSSRRRSLGLFGIQERVALLGGGFQIWSEPGKGTRIAVSVPLARSRSAEGGGPNEQDKVVAGGRPQSREGGVAYAAGERR